MRLKNTKTNFGADKTTLNGGIIRPQLQTNKLTNKRIANFLRVRTVPSTLRVFQMGAYILTGVRTCTGHCRLWMWVQKWALLSECCPHRTTEPHEKQFSPVPKVSDDVQNYPPWGNFLYSEPTMSSVRDQRKFQAKKCELLYKVW